ncbi:hypothetical protein DENSPDRAFT_459848 [Dentipellis sp. KUC8613]|nr:hypothetical protein DENSPDRAFT_459848 [Dentipellis sp. KUC8613]
MAMARRPIATGSLAGSRSDARNVCAYTYTYACGASNRLAIATAGICPRPRRHMYQDDHRPGARPSEALRAKNLRLRPYAHGDVLTKRDANTFCHACKFRAREVLCGGPIQACSAMLARLPDVGTCYGVGAHGLRAHAVQVGWSWCQIFLSMTRESPLTRSSRNTIAGDVCMHMYMHIDVPLCRVRAQRPQDPQSVPYPGDTYTRIIGVHLPQRTYGRPCGCVCAPWPWAHSAEAAQGRPSVRCTVRIRRCWQGPLCSD